MLRVTDDPTMIVGYLERAIELQFILQCDEMERTTQDRLEKRLAEAREHIINILVENQHTQKNRKESLMIPFQDILNFERIEEGGFGVVFKGIVAGTPVAIKVAKDLTAMELRKLAEELENMEKLSHPHLARFMGTTKVPHMGLAIVSELCDTDLSKVCQEERENNPHFQTKMVRWLCEAAEGIAWLHTMCHMIHRDIKPDNILLKNGHAVVTDFGFTQVLDTADDSLQETNLMGCKYFLAPEILRHQPFSYPADVYAFGMTMYSVALGKVPAKKGYQSYDDLFHDVCKGVRPDVSELTCQEINNLLIELIKACWDGDPQKRPKMPDICKRLKEIFVETVVPQTSPAYGFWLQHFGDKLADEVCVSELLNHLPNKENKDVVDAYMWILKGRLNPHTVTLRHLANTCEWYGDWLHNGTAVSIKTSLSEHKWFLGFASREAAQQCGMDYLSEHQESCFTVRCSETNPSFSPFTIDVFTSQSARSYRVHRTSENKLVCTKMNRESHGGSIIELVNALRAHNMLVKVNMYDGTVSRLRDKNPY